MTLKRYAHPATESPTSNDGVKARDSPQPMLVRGGGKHRCLRGLMNLRNPS